MKRYRFEITSQCSFGCRHCYITPETGNLPDLKTDEIKAVLDKISEGTQVKILFLGGEPFERSDIMEILSYSKRIGIETGVDSNGWNIPIETLDELKRINLDSLNLTLYGTEEKINDSFTRKGHFKRTLKLIEHSQKIGLKTDVAILITNRNFGQLFKISDFKKKYNIRKIYIDVFMTSDENNNSEIYRLSSFQHYLFWGILRWLLIDKKDKDKNIAVSNCDDMTFPLIKSNGDIWPCLFYRKAIANILNQSRDEVEKRLNEYQLEDEICFNCISRKLDKPTQFLSDNFYLFRLFLRSAHRIYTKAVRKISR